VAEVVSLPQRHDQTLMGGLTALELIAAVVIPPFLGGYLVRRRSTAAAGPAGPFGSSAPPRPSGPSGLSTPPGNGGGS
jgi:hypothetical protein